MHKHISVIFILTLCTKLLLAYPVLWAGGVTTNSFTVRAVDYNGKTLTVSTTADLSNPVSSVVVDSNVLSYQVTGLNAGTKYFYGFTDGDIASVSTFKTGKSSFKFGFGSCAGTGSNSPVWTALNSEGLDLFVQMGDLHYENIAVNDTNLYLGAFRTIFGGDKQRLFLQSLPLAYTWDDHDFGPNDANSLSPSKVSARANYQAAFPHYPLPGGRSGDVAIYQAFTVGNVRFVATDLRSESLPSTGSNATIMSQEQKQWFFSELSQASNYSMVVWVSSVPWIGASEPGGDSWSGFHAERVEIGNFIKSNNILNLIMIAGDAHMVAFDDGSNSDYSEGGGAGFPVFQAAPIHRWGSSKGGPFSEGCYSYAHHYIQQYGVMEVNDDGPQTCITVTGFRVPDWGPKEKLVTYEACAPFVKTGSPGSGKCEVEMVPLYGIISGAVGGGVALIVIILYIILCCARERKAPIVVPLVIFILLVLLAVGGAVMLRTLSPHAPLIQPAQMGFVLCGLDLIFLIIYMILFICGKKSDGKRRKYGQKFELM